MSYKEFEVDTIGYDGKVSPFTFNLSNISYYRPFVDSAPAKGKTPKIQTMVYLVGSIKAIHVNCSYDVFKEKIKDIQGN